MKAIIKEQVRGPKLAEPNPLFHDLMKSRVLGKEVIWVDCPSDFDKIPTGNLDLGGKIIIYIPRNFKYNYISNIKYLMRGAYPNIDNLSYLGHMANVFQSGLKLQGKLGGLTNEENKIKEKHIHYLTGYQNISLETTPYSSLEDELRKQIGTVMLAVSVNSESIFEMNDITLGDIREVIPFIKVPLMIF